LTLSCIVLDRSNLGNARLQGLPEDALGGDPTGTLFDVINSVFFIAYACANYLKSSNTVFTDVLILQIVVQIPMTIVSKLFPPRSWFAGVALGWGTTSILMVNWQIIGNSSHINPHHSPQPSIILA